MATLGEIRLAAFGTVPPGWMPCDGALLPIQTNQPLFALLGTYYGGNGQTNFALPDLRGRVPIHASNNDFFTGQRGGEEWHVLTVNEMPAHAHQLMMQPVAATTSNPTGALLAIAPATLGDVYGSSGLLVPMNGGAVLNSGSGAPHNNMQPYMALMFIINTTGGFFPTEL